MVEDLFTLPALRRRGIATAAIARAIEHVHTQGAGPIVIGTHAGARPKRLYAALGFAPVCPTRDYIRHIDRRASTTEAETPTTEAEKMRCSTW